MAVELAISPLAVDSKILINQNWAVTEVPQGKYLTAADLASKLAWINGMIVYTVIAAAVTMVIEAICEIRHLLRGTRRTRQARQAAQVEAL